MVRRALALCLLALAAGCGGAADEELTLPSGQHFVVTSSLSPRTIACGDTLTAELRLLFDRRRVDPEQVRLLHRFLPYRDRTTVERVDDGNLTALTYTIKLECLTNYCLPPSGPWRFPITRISTGSGPVREVEWPPFQVATRLSEPSEAPEGTGEEGASWPPAWRAAVSMPEPDYRAPPSLLAWGVGIAGAMLLAGSAAAGLLLLRRGRLLRERVVSPLDRAFALLRAARTDEERRAALEALALALDGEVETLAQPARQLAWSQSSPSADDAAALAALAKGSR
jgi:hypothetical protein